MSCALQAPAGTDALPCCFDAISLREAGFGIAQNALQHVPEKACPALDAGWKPASRKDHAQTKR